MLSKHTKAVIKQRKAKGFWLKVSAIVIPVMVAVMIIAIILLSGVLTPLM